MTQHTFRKLAAMHFNSVAADYAHVAVLQQQVSQRLLSDLSYLTISPRVCLDLGCNTGLGIRQLAKQYKSMRFPIGIDIAMGMLQQAKARTRWWNKCRYVAGDAAQLPLASASVDLVYAALVLHWCSDTMSVLREVSRVLRPGGVFVFAAYGPDTLRELRASWAQVDNHQHTLSFMDMHSIGDALLAAGLADPVLHTEQFTLSYPDPEHVVRDIKAMGASYVGEGRCPGLTGKARWQRFIATYQRDYLQQGRIPASYEVVYGHAWAKPLISAAVSQEVHIPVSAIRRR